MITTEEAISLIEKEKERRGATDRHDDFYANGGLLSTARSYFLMAPVSKTKLQDLIHAGALCLEEQDRLKRVNPPSIVFEMMRVDSLMSNIIHAMSTLYAPKSRSVPDRLSSLGKLFEERNAVYTNDYKHYGEVLVGMFPKGLTLNTAEDFNRMYLFIHMLSKINRYASMIKRGGHADSLNDIAVYSQMAAELDDEVRDAK